LNLKRTLQISFIFLLTLIPSLVFAYSPYVIPGGENVGIRLNTKYVTIVGFYKVNDRYIAEESGFQVGDSILKIENEDVTDIDQMISLIDQYKEKSEISISFLRNGKSLSTSLKLEKDDSGIYKTGIYVKDQINGIGTLSYIDPNTLNYGALGHEIADKNSYEKVELKNGKIFKSEVTDIRPSRDGTPGEKQAHISTDDIYGDIVKNGYNNIEVCEPEDVKRGKASIRTVLSGNNIEEFEINILEIDASSPTKNILFQITDKRLLEQTGGIVAGMSGSPIIQDNKLIGAVTHVVVNDTDKGYGIFITTMLKEGEEEED